MVKFLKILITTYELYHSFFLFKDVVSDPFFCLSHIFEEHLTMALLNLKDAILIGNSTTEPKNFDIKTIIALVLLCYIWKVHFSHQPFSEIFSNFVHFRPNFQYLFFHLFSLSAIALEVDSKVL